MKKPRERSCPVCEKPLPCGCRTTWLRLDDGTEVAAVWGPDGAVAIEPAADKE